MRMRRSAPSAPAPAATTRPPIRYFIEATLEGEPLEPMDLPDTGEFLVGRNERADLVLRHLTVRNMLFTLSTYTAGVVLDSFYPSETFVNGLSVSEQMEITEGDEVRIGLFSFILRSRAHP